MLKRHLGLTMVLLGMAGISFAASVDSIAWSIFSTKGHPKAADLDVIIKYPATWQKVEMPSKTIIQGFKPQDGDNDWASIALIRTPLPGTEGRVITVQEIRAIDFLELEKAQLRALPRVSA